MYELKMLLTEEDAKALLAITWQIAGDPENSPRVMTNNLGNALSNAGVRRSNSNFTLEGTLTFTKKEAKAATTVTTCKKV